MRCFQQALTLTLLSFSCTGLVLFSWAKDTSTWVIIPNALTSWRNIDSKNFVSSGWRWLTAPPWVWLGASALCYAWVQSAANALLRNRWPKQQQLGEARSHVQHCWSVEMSQVLPALAKAPPTLCPLTFLWPKQSQGLVLSPWARFAYFLKDVKGSVRFAGQRSAVTVLNVEITAVIKPEKPVAWKCSDVCCALGRGSFHSNSAGAERKAILSSYYYMCKCTRAGVCFFSWLSSLSCLLVNIDAIPDGTLIQRLRFNLGNVGVGAWQWKKLVFKRRFQTRIQWVFKLSGSGLPAAWLLVLTLRHLTITICCGKDHCAALRSSLLLTSQPLACWEKKQIRKNTGGWCLHRKLICGAAFTIFFTISDSLPFSS